MPPKKGSTSTYPKIDPKSILPSHQLCLNLHDNREDCFYDYNNLVWGLRTLYSIGGKKFNLKAQGSKSSKSEENFFLVQLLYHGLNTHILIEKYTLYLIALTCQGKWKLPFNAKYAIEDAEMLKFDTEYPREFVFEVGDDVLRSCVYALNSSNSDDWELSYYRLALNISEAVRFPPIHKLFISLEHCDMKSRVLEGFEKWLARNWDKLSKIWKLYCRYGIWDPLDVLPSLYKHGDIKHGMLAVLGDADFGRKTIAILLDCSIATDIKAVEKKAIDEKGDYRPIDPKIY